MLCRQPVFCGELTLRPQDVVESPCISGRLLSIPEHGPAGSSQPVGPFVCAQFFYTLLHLNRQRTQLRLADRDRVVFHQVLVVALFGHAHALSLVCEVRGACVSWCSQ